MKIPDEAREVILRTQGENGKTFLDKLPQRLENYTEKWKLSDCHFLTHSTNIIFVCKSAIYGDVVIKAGVPEDKRLLTEISAIKFYNKNPHTCKLHDYSLEDGFSLFEKLTPGQPLIKAIADPFKRVDVFLNIYKDYHLPCKDTDTYPTYASLVDAFKVNLGGRFEKYKDVYTVLFKELSSEYKEKCLLHGDLQHYGNIISHGKEFKVIDPHGIIGASIFDLSRYLTNELSHAMWENRDFGGDVVMYMSESLGLPIQVLYALLVIDVTHHAGYHLGNPISEDRYMFNLRRCELAYELYKSHKSFLNPI